MLLLNQKIASHEASYTIEMTRQMMQINNKLNHLMHIQVNKIQKIYLLQYQSLLTHLSIL
ncbi:hypothetical protein [Rhabdochlamydiaceae symbiont of Dictyostelium giganteum]|uniref:hypothetical protein n=1 Tax=Rhabdochlamydiaceae symbiont of Dictyostelium giganteum TaxID=3342349 RepID=UPI00384B8399